jgi:hypothetical protein
VKYLKSSFYLFIFSETIVEKKETMQGFSYAMNLVCVHGNQIERVPTSYQHSFFFFFLFWFQFSKGDSKGRIANEHSKVD